MADYLQENKSSQSVGFCLEMRGSCLRMLWHLGREKEKEGFGLMSQPVGVKKPSQLFFSSWKMEAKGATDRPVEPLQAHLWFWESRGKTKVLKISDAKMELQREPDLHGAHQHITRQTNSNHT